MRGDAGVVARRDEDGVIVSHDGVVYEKDLGTNTLYRFKSMERFNPDKSWIPVSEEGE